MESLYIRSMPKMLQEERKIEGKRDIKRERRRRRYIYMFLLPVEEPPTLKYLFTSLNVKLIHRFINQSINRSPNHPSKIMNLLILIATALFTTLVSCDVRIPILLLLPPLPPHHTPIISISISHNNLLITSSLTPKPKSFNNRNAWPSPEESAMEVELVTAELQKVESVRLVER